ncbi:MAG: hypothetical protein BWY62_00719 [Firmicutes bacterium ADurb.Bin356]|nr:MAG: hypothetical protein BWY62_00719 [Firmicutes bacterium ADurb.Bin356]
MRVAFKHRTVHKSTRVAFVCIAANIFNIAYRLLSERPFNACGESAAETGTLYNINNFIRRKFKQAFCKRPVTIKSNIFFDTLRVDNSAVAQRHPVLFFIEVHLIKGANVLAFVNALRVEKVSHDTPFNKMFRNNPRYVFNFYMAIESAFRIDNYNWPCFAQPKTACWNNLNFVF